MLRKHHVYIVAAIVSIAAAASCTKEYSQENKEYSQKNEEYSQEIAEGKTLYITSSKAGGKVLADMGPNKATISMKESGDGQCDLLVSYEFFRSATERPVISFRIPNVAVSSDASRYILEGESLHGECSYDARGRGNVFFDYEDVSVSGSIGFDGNSGMDISGIIGREPFSIKVLETSVNYPGSQVAVGGEVCLGEFKRITVCNKTKTPCHITFNLSQMTVQQNVLDLNSGDDGMLSFMFAGFFWKDTCSDIVISLDGGDTYTIPGPDIQKMNAGESIGVLKLVGPGTFWQIITEDINHCFVPMGFPMQQFEIIEPESE